MAEIDQFTIKPFSNASFGQDISGKNFSHQQFIDFSGHKKKIADCDFSYCVFQRVYFRKVQFINCNFTGSRFFDSNLKDAEFEGCKFPYSTFKFTLIRIEQVQNNLPEWPNVKTQLLQIHKANAASLGDIRTAREYLLMEIEANKEHLRRARKRSEGYYRNKYRGFYKQVTVYWKSFWLKMDDLLWGHGESPWKIPRNIVLCLLIFGITQTVQTAVGLKLSTQDFFLSMWQFIKIDFKVFLGLPGPWPINTIWKVILILLRYLSLSLFIRILFNKYSWR